MRISARCHMSFSVYLPRQGSPTWSWDLSNTLLDRVLICSISSPKAFPVLTGWSQKQSGESAKRKYASSRLSTPKVSLVYLSFNANFTLGENTSSSWIVTHQVSSSFLVNVTCKGLSKILALNCSTSLSVQTSLDPSSRHLIACTGKLRRSGLSCFIAATGRVSVFP